MFEIIPVAAAPGGDAYLLVTSGKTALIDSGYAFCASQLIENIKSHLGDRPLDYVFLTHTHYDHASGSAYCRHEWPNLQVVGSAYAKKVFSRPSAIRTMREMNDAASLRWGTGSYDDKLDDLDVDLVVSDGDIIDMGVFTFTVYEAPGHTRDSIAYYSPQADLFISCETLGTIPFGQKVMPCFLVGYQICIDAIERLRPLAPKYMVLPHYGLISGEWAENYFDDALACHEETKERILEGYKAGKNKEELMAILKDMFYKDRLAAGQPVEAFMLNPSYTVPMIIKECLGEEI